MTISFLTDLLEKQKGKVSGQFVKSDNIIFSLASPALARRRQRDFLCAHGLDGKRLCHYLESIAKIWFILVEQNKNFLN